MTNDEMIIMTKKKKQEKIRPLYARGRVRVVDIIHIVGYLMVVR